MALLALISPQHAKRGGWRAAMVIVGLIGATLLYGDGTITPAISVSSAIEGIKLYAPQMGRFVVPLTLIILVILFLIQHKGTSWIGMPRWRKAMFSMMSRNAQQPGTYFNIPCAQVLEIGVEFEI